MISLVTSPRYFPDYRGNTDTEEGHLYLLVWGMERTAGRLEKATQTPLARLGLSRWGRTCRQRPDFQVFQIQAID